MGKKLFVLFFLLLISFYLTSCTREVKKEAGPIVVEMWVMPNSLEPIKDLETVLKPFEEAHPGIKVKVTSIDWGAAWTKITTAATSGDVPDIVQLGTTWVGAISGMGALADLKNKVDEIGGGAAFVPAAWGTSGIIGSNQVTAIPWFVDVRALYYRTDVFKSLGLKASDLNTWSSFVKTLEKIKRAKPVIEGIVVAPIGIPGKNDWNVVHNLAPWIWGAGGDFLGIDKKHSILNKKEALTGVSFYIDIARAGYVPLDYLELNTAQVSSNFNNGSCAMYFDGPYEVKTLTTPPQQGGAAGSLTARNFGVVPYPQGPKGRFTFVGGSDLSIFKRAKHPKEAWEVIKYLMTKDAQVSYSKATGFVPARKAAFDDPFFAADPKRRVFKEAIKYGKSYPCIASWGLLEPILTRRFGIMWDYVTGTKEKFNIEEIQKQLNLAVSEVDEVLTQER